MGPIRLTWRLVKTHYWGPPALAQGVHATGFRVWHEIQVPGCSWRVWGPGGPRHRPGEEGVKDGVVGGADGAGTCCLIAELASRFSRQ